MKSSDKLMIVLDSTMSSNLSSMSSSCLQQARDHSSYPYMFHDPLHSLSSSYNHSRVAACSPAVPMAHQGQVSHPGAYHGAPGSAGGPPGSATGTGRLFSTDFDKTLLCYQFGLDAAWPVWKSVNGSIKRRWAGGVHPSVLQ